MKTLETMEERFYEVSKHWDIASSVRPLLRYFIAEERNIAVEEERVRVRGLVERMKRKGNPQFETNQDFGYNQALSDILDILGERK